LKKKKSSLTQAAWCSRQAVFVSGSKESAVAL
jgi:hypothetical protein